MKKVLIVDDEANIREIIKMNLELSGYECFEAEDGEKSIQMLEKITPDIALLAIMMPNKDGFEISDEFVKRDIPIIFLTAKANVNDKVKGLKLGADDYIVKPFEGMELLARIEMWSTSLMITWLHTATLATPLTTPPTVMNTLMGMKRQREEAG